MGGWEGRGVSGCVNRWVGRWMGGSVDRWMKVQAGKRKTEDGCN